MTQVVRFLRAAQIHRTATSAGLIPISRSLWHKLVQDGVAPQPVRVGRVCLWRAEDVSEFADRLSRGEVTA